MARDPQHPILEVLRDAANEGDAVVARREGDAWEVSSVGGKGPIRRVEHAGAGSGAATLLMEGLRQFFGEPIGREVFRQMGFRADRDEVLDAKAVLAALEMASASQSAFAGLNFITRQSMSAKSLSPQFRLVCMAAGVVPEKIPPRRLAAADELFARRFVERADSDRRSVDLIEGRLLMAEALAEALQER